MDAGTIVAIVIASLTGLGIGITLIVLLVRGGFLLGRLFNRVELWTSASMDWTRALRR